MVRTKSDKPQRYVDMDRELAASNMDSGVADSRHGDEDSAADAMGSDSVVNVSSSTASSSAPQAVVEEPPAKVSKLVEEPAAKVSKPLEPASNKENAVKDHVCASQEDIDRRYTSKWMRAYESREQLIACMEAGCPRAAVKKGKENDSLVINAMSTTAKGSYRPYRAGDEVMDSRMNTRCRAVLGQEKSQALPTLSLPILSGVQNCCTYELLSFNTPPFPRNLPPLNGMKLVICFDATASNARDHSHVWRYMDQVSHRQSIKWLRSERRLTSTERMTVVPVKDFNNKLLCKICTFCRVEEGIAHA